LEFILDCEANRNDCGNILSIPVDRSKLAKTTEVTNENNFKMGGWGYIMCSLNHSTLYAGVTSNLPSRVYQHKMKTYPNSFTAKYNCIKLVYYQRFETIIDAIIEEKRIKGGSRKKNLDQQLKS
jgi:putative endonuclease